jgi:hypothetical protein
MSGFIVVCPLAFDDQNLANPTNLVCSPAREWIVFQLQKNDKKGDPNAVRTASRGIYAAPSYKMKMESLAVS